MGILGYRDDFFDVPSVGGGTIAPAIATWEALDGEVRAIMLSKTNMQIVYKSVKKPSSTL